MVIDHADTRDAYMNLQQKLRAKSVRLLGAVENGLTRMIVAWFLIAMLASALRIMVSPLPAAPDLGTITPYILLVGAPLASMGLALTWFANGDSLPQPKTRLARVGKWRRMSPDEARGHALYGSSGIMVSLLIGMILNVPVRALEYLAAMPALAGSIPPWLSTLRFAMTFDVVLLTSLYTVAFVAALRRVPLFPRLLVAIWLIDISMQLFIAKATIAAGDLPLPVAGQLHDLLDGNVKKVLISIGLWLPYLILSERVNVTFRHRRSA